MSEEEKKDENEVATPAPATDTNADDAQESAPEEQKEA